RADCLEATHRRAHLALVERLLDATVGAQALAGLDAAMARDAHRRLVALEIVEMRAALARDLEQVAEALRRDQSGLRAAMLDQRVRRDGGAVTEITDVRRTFRRLRLATGLAQPLDDTGYDR